MAQKKISLKGLADYMTASPTRQRTVLRQFKYPQEDEAQAKIIYYREARDRVAVLHRSGHDGDWLMQQAAQLETLASLSTGQTKTRLRHNARGLKDYARHFAKRDFEILADVRLSLKFGEVLVSVVPEFARKRKG